MKIGIDKIGFYTPSMYIDMVDLAHARDEDPNKYLIGIGQSRQAVIPNTQDAVTMGANAANSILDAKNRRQIRLIILGTENGVDNSKSTAVYVQNLLRLSNNAVAFEVKQACFGASAGLQIAYDYISNHPDHQALVIGSDIARYGLNTPGEVTQGGGAIAMIVSKDPQIIAFDHGSTFYTKDIMDFWRPLAKTNALVNGHYSNHIYEDFFQKTWHRYLKQNHLTISDFAALLFHLPYTKMGLKGLRTVLPEASSEQQRFLLKRFKASCYYSRYVGNLYTGSLYLSLLSLLDNSGDLQIGDRIGLFSYGSGAQGEFYSGILQNGFKNSKRKRYLQKLLRTRRRLTIAQYEKIYRNWLPIDANNVILDYQDDPAKFVLKGIKDWKRLYIKH